MIPHVTRCSFQRTWHLKNGFFHWRFVITPMPIFTGRFWRIRKLLQPAAVLSEGSLLSTGRRQLEFEMREIVLLGDPEWSNEKIALIQAQILRIAEVRSARPLGDRGRSLFPSNRKGKALIQRLMETKKELVCDRPRPLPSPASTGTAHSSANASPSSSPTRHPCTLPALPSD